MNRGGNRGYTQDLFTDGQGDDYPETEGTYVPDSSDETDGNETDDKETDDNETVGNETTGDVDPAGKTKKSRAKNKVGSGTLVVRRVDSKGGPASPNATRATYGNDIGCIV